MAAIYKRDLRAYFTSPVGYVFIAAFVFVMNLIFYIQNMMTAQNRLTTVFSVIFYALIVLAPVLTMRTFSEEYKQKTDQLLLTSPVSLTRIVAGKYLAAVTLLGTAAALTLLYAGVVAMYGQIYPAELAVNYLGFLLQGCAFAAIDLYCSGLAGTPVTAAVLAFGANFLLWILDLAETAVQAEWIAGILRFCSLYRRNEAFLMGQLSFAGVLFDLSVIVLFLALTVYHMDRKRIGR